MLKTICALSKYDKYFCKLSYTFCNNINAVYFTNKALRDSALEIYNPEIIEFRLYMILKISKDFSSGHIKAPNIQLVIEYKV